MTTTTHNPGRFAPGNQAAKGNRRGKPLPPHGRTLVLETLSRMLQQRANQRRLMRALQRKLEQDPYLEALL